MTLLWIFLGILLVSLVVFAGLLRVAMKWGQEGLELQQYGREVSGVVVEKRSVQRRGARSTRIRYEYVDHVGTRHRSRRSLVTPEAWDAHVEGGPIAVVYSQRNPKISLPKYLLGLTPHETGTLNFRLSC